MALSVLAYNLTRVMNIVGIKPLIAAEADFQAWRDQRNGTERKYAMWHAGKSCRFNSHRR